MKTHFHRTEEILNEHSAWPLYDVHIQLVDYMEKCKAIIADVRKQNKGPGLHQRSVEAVHAKHLNIQGWHFHKMHNTLMYHANEAGVPFHIVLETPYTGHEDVQKVYVNVALAWLFAAKRQLMNILETMIEKKMIKTGKEQEYISESKKGKEARNEYLKHKHALGVRHHANPYNIQDAADLKHQYDLFHGAH